MGDKDYLSIIYSHEGAYDNNAYLTPVHSKYCCNSGPYDRSTCTSECSIGVKNYEKLRKTVYANDPNVDAPSINNGDYNDRNIEANRTSPKQVGIYIDTRKPPDTVSRTDSTEDNSGTDFSISTTTTRLSALSSCPSNTRIDMPLPDIPRKKVYSMDAEPGRLCTCTIRKAVIVTVIIIVILGALGGAAYGIYYGVTHKGENFQTVVVYGEMSYVNVSTVEGSFQKNFKTTLVSNLRNSNILYQSFKDAFTQNIDQVRSVLPFSVNFNMDPKKSNTGLFEALERIIKDAFEKTRGITLKCLTVIPEEITNTSKYNCSYNLQEFPGT